MSDHLMTLPEVADFLRVPVGTLYQWRHRGVGPASIKVGRHVRFSRAAVDAWLEARTSGSATA